MCKPKIFENPVLQNLLKIQIQAQTKILAEQIIAKDFAP